MGQKKWLLEELVDSIYIVTIKLINLFFTLFEIFRSARVERTINLNFYNSLLRMLLLLRILLDLFLY